MLRIVLVAALVLGVFGAGTASGVTASARVATDSSVTNGNALPRTYYVAPPPVGDDSNPGTSPDLAWATPQKAANTVVAGDTVLVGPGTYTKYSGSTAVLSCQREGTADRPIVFKADGPRGAVIFDNGGSGEVVQLYSHTVFDGFTIRNGLTGVRADAANGVIVKNCEIYDMRRHGVHFSRSAVCQVINNVIHDQRVQGDDSGHCVYIEKSHDTIEDENHVIRGNVCYKWKGTAIAVKPYGNGDHRSAGIMIENNVCYDCPYGAIAVSNVWDATIRNNLCYSTGIESRTQGGMIEVYTDCEPSDDPEALAPRNVDVANNTCVCDDKWRASVIELDHTGHAWDIRVFNNILIGLIGIRDYGDRNWKRYNFEGPYTQSDLDSLFLDPRQQDYHLKPRSPGIDSGVGWVVVSSGDTIRAAANDCDGIPRPVGGIDLGAFEYDVSYNLEVDKTGSGKVVRTPDRVRFAPGEQVLVSAVPDSGWSFAYWSGGTTGEQNPMNLIFTGDVSVTAHFVSEAKRGLTPPQDVVVLTSTPGCATVSWRVSPESEVAGYVVAYGPVSVEQGRVATYADSVEAGNVTSVEVCGVREGRYYFAVRAYKASGETSGYSPERTLDFKKR